MKIKNSPKRCRKVQFKTAKLAYRARDSAVASGGFYDGVHAYKCPWCGTFHLGHRD